MTAEVKYVDHGLTRVLKNLVDLEQLDVTVGFQGDKGAAIHPDAEVSVATIAMFNEFGTIDSPARNFLRATMFERRADIIKRATAEYAKVAEGRQTALEAQSAVGRYVAGLVVDKIARSPSWAAANEASTISKKGHAKPLLGGNVAKNIAGGTMTAAVSWAVRRGGAIVAEGTP